MHSTFDKTKMMNYYLRTILLTACCLFSVHMTALDTECHLTSRRLSTANGLLSNMVYDMVQDHRGYLWFGGDNALCRYDGYQIMTFDYLEIGKERLRANVGNLYLDSLNMLLWIRTVNYHYACYNLRHHRFEDYTCGATPRRSYRRCLMTRHGLWLSDDGAGLRHVGYENGEYRLTDYTQENGRLPSNQVKLFFEDSDGCIWAILDKEVVRIDRQHGVKTMIKASAATGNWADDHCLLITGTDELLVLAKDGKIVKHTPLPAGIRAADLQRSTFVWQNRWVLPAHGYLAMMDCRNFTFSLPPELQLERGLLLDQEDGNYAVGDGGTICLFPKQGDAVRLSLMSTSHLAGSRTRKFTTRVGLDGRFYMASYGSGLFVYDPATHATQHYRATDSQPLIATDYLISMLCDRSGGIWVSMEDAGLSCISTSRRLKAEYILPAPSQQGEWANQINRICIDYAGQLMMSTRDNRLHRVLPDERRTEVVSTFQACPQSYAYDAGHRIWIGTRGDGLYIDNTHYSPLDSGAHYFPARIVSDLVLDKKGRMWIATKEQGLFMTEPMKDDRLQLTQLLNRNINENRISDIDLDSKGRLWIATYGGLFSVDTNNDKISNNQILEYNSVEGLLPYSDIRAMMVAADGALWIGGKGMGAVRMDVSDPQHPTATTYGQREGLPNSNVYSFVEDLWNEVWIATEGWLTRMNVNKGTVESYDASQEGVLRGIFAENCAVQMPDGRLAFGTGEGVALITPPNPVQYSAVHLPKSYIIDILVGNMSVFNSDADRWDIDDNCLRLAYDENTLSFHFSCFDYAGSATVRYQYWLEGYDRDWLEPTTAHSATYGNLRPGRYTFHVRSVGVRDLRSVEAVFTIVIRQPWWNTWWAWLLYLLTIAGITYYIYRNWRDKFDLHQRMKLEKQLTEIRIDFYTHVTHEFRTPLSIISNGVSRVMEGEPVTRKTVQVIRRGTRRLTQLVNQLMEFRKVSTDNLRLQVEQGDIISFVRDVYHDFYDMAQQKELNMTITTFDKHCDMLFDRHIVDTVIYNLLSNAVKYTPEKGSITVRISKDDAHIIITVEDNGKGISNEHQEQLFKPFMNGYASQGGMGIGLFTAHRMAETHHGSLSYENTGHGSLFTFLLPVTSDVYEAEEYRTPLAIDAQTKDREQAEAVIREMQTPALNSQLVVVIEDEPDMLDELKTELGVYFRVEGYQNGATGFDAITQKHPALVVCDVMLPDMNGYDIVKNIKNSANTADIPVIMLTALDDDNHQVKGYEAGADDYMVKPCNFRVLIARVIQLIRWQQRKEKRDGQSAETVSSQQQEAKPQALPREEFVIGEETILTSKVDKVFLEKMQTYMDQHISDPTFNMDQLAQMLCMGRTKFYGKVRELTGMTPNKFLLQERMRKAADLLLEGEMNISEVCYRVGIQDPSYFNKCFKTQYGVSPSKYGKM